MLQVVDASAVLGCVINEPGRNSLLAASLGKRLIAPKSLDWEIGNAFSAMFKRRRIQIDQAIAGLRLFRQMPIEQRAIDLEAAVILADRLGIYAYDAYVLQCAIQSGAEVLTLDGGLKTAGRAAGVSFCEVTP